MQRRKLNGEGIDLLYPDTLPMVNRLPNGDVVLPNGDVLPFAASCPPDTTADWASKQCVPMRGTENVNYQCGGTLAPWGQNGCVQHTELLPSPPAPAPRVVQLRETTDRYPQWSSCHQVGPTLDQFAASLPCALLSTNAGELAKDSGAGLAWFGCLIVGLALVGAAADVVGGRH